MSSLRRDTAAGWNMPARTVCTYRLVRDCQDVPIDEGVDDERKWMAFMGEMEADEQVLGLVVLYMDRLLRGSGGADMVGAHPFYRIATTAAMLAFKFTLDEPPLNKAFAETSGIPNIALNKLEGELLRCIGYACMATEVDRDQASVRITSIMARWTRTPPLTPPASPSPTPGAVPPQRCPSTEDLLDCYHYMRQQQMVAELEEPATQHDAPPPPRPVCCLSGAWDDLNVFSSCGDESNPSLRDEVEQLPWEIRHAILSVEQEWDRHTVMGTRLQRSAVPWGGQRPCDIGGACLMGQGVCTHQPLQGRAHRRGPPPPVLAKMRGDTCKQEHNVLRSRNQWRTAALMQPVQILAQHYFC